MKTILFDLDGTLLPVDNDEFVKVYMKSLVTFIAPHLPLHLVPQQFPEHLMASTYAMVANADPTVSNAAAFWSDFSPRIGATEQELTPHFDRFYREQFPLLKEHFQDRLPGLARSVVSAAVDRGYEIVLATNPLFPRVAIEERMRWAGIEGFPWRLVTVYEEMHFCKPQPGYYLEICSLIGRPPEDCLMVGNDVDEDGVAAKIGMNVFIVTDYLINKREKALDPRRSGSLKDLLHLLHNGAFE